MHYVQHVHRWWKLIDSRRQSEFDMKTCMFCSIALLLCWPKASFVGGMFSTDLPFLVNSSRLQVFMSLTELVKSYSRITKSSITETSSSVKTSVADSLLEGEWQNLTKSGFTKHERN